MKITVAYQIQEAWNIIIIRVPEREERHERMKALLNKLEPGGAFERKEVKYMLMRGCMEYTNYWRENVPYCLRKLYK